MGLQSIKIKIYKRAYEFIEGYLIKKDEKYLLLKANKLINSEADRIFSLKEWGNIRSITTIYNKQ